MREYRVQIVYKAIDELKPYKRNPRNNDGAVDAVAASYARLTGGVYSICY